MPLPYRSGRTLTLGAPGFAGSANGQLVKLLVDGALTALHAYADTSTLEEVAPNMSERIGLTGREIEALIADDTHAVLGKKPRLLVNRADGLQCRPDDHRVGRLLVQIDRDATQWSITGELTLT